MTRERECEPEVGHGGEALGTYASVVPSFRKLPSLTSRSPGSMPGWSPAELPTRMKLVTPTRASSSTAIAVEGSHPVEVAVMCGPL